MDLGFWEPRNREIASWVVRIGWVRLISSSAYRDLSGESRDSGEPGGYQKFEKCYKRKDSSERILGSGGEPLAYRLVNPSSGTDDVYLAKFPLCHLEHPLQLRPVGDICLLEDRSGG